MLQPPAASWPFSAQQPLVQRASPRAEAPRRLLVHIETASGFRPLLQLLRLCGYTRLPQLELSMPGMY
jgi:hypothetical protein